MKDTQWPRFQVFLQEKEGAPHQDAGSVHAPDAELALMNARDVFVRRPECVSLWVVPAERIYWRTAEEIRRLGAGDPEQDKGQAETYYVFHKARPAGTHTEAGTVEAGSPAQALEKGVQTFSGSRQPFSWLVFPARLVVRSDPDDLDSMFTPARDKPFRLATDFHTLTAMRNLREKQ